MHIAAMPTKILQLYVLCSNVVILAQCFRYATDAAGQKGLAGSERDDDNAMEMEMHIILSIGSN